MLSKRLGDAITVIVDPHLRILLFLIDWLRWRWDSVVDVSRCIVGLLHFTAPRVSEKSLAGYVAASWSSVVMVAILVNLIENPGEILL